MDTEMTKYLLGLYSGSLQAAQDRRISGADQLADLTRNEYLARSGSVSFREGTGQRLVTESGAGRTRLEANRPHETSAAAA